MQKENEIMDAFGKIVATVLLGAGAVFLAVVVGPLFGGFAVWLVSLVFSYPVDWLLAKTGIDTAFHLGAVLALVGGFFRSSFPHKKRD